jgi:putative tricarboxylic transport membrane protein
MRTDFRCNDCVNFISRHAWSSDSEHSLEGIFQRVNQVPVPVLIALIVGLSVIGSYALQNSLFDVWMLLFFGILGYVMRKLNFMPAALVLGMILSPVFERGLRQGLSIGRGDPSFFWASPISQVLIALCLAILLYPLIRTGLARWRTARLRP